jgi:exodeoxyribonuclease VII small subunit
MENPNIDQLTYEQAFNELEKIIESLESAQASLEESLGLFERGQGLLKQCSSLLDKAELKIRTLSTGSPQTSADEE